MSLCHQTTDNSGRWADFTFVFFEKKRLRKLPLACKPLDTTARSEQRYLQ